MRTVRLDLKTTGSGTRKARYIARQGELDRIHDAAFPRPIRSAGGEVLSLEIKGQIADAAKLIYMDLVNPDYDESGNRAARIDGSANTPSLSTTLRSLDAISSRHSSSSKLSKNSPRIVAATEVTFRTFSAFANPSMYR